MSHRTTSLLAFILFEEDVQTIPAQNYLLRSRLWGISSLHTWSSELPGIEYLMRPLVSRPSQVRAKFGVCLDSNPYLVGQDSPNRNICATTPS